MKILTATFLTTLCAQSLLGLDFGADYPVLPPQPDHPGFYAGLAELYTHFGDTQPDISIVGTSLDSQHLNTLTSEPFLGYNFNDRIGVELELPVLYREFDAIQGTGNVLTEFIHIHGTEWGMGDIRLQGHVAVLKMETPEYTVHWNVSAGIKFPTGDSSALASPGGLPNPVRTNGPGGLPIIGDVPGITGTDLALGSGSYDGLIGTDILLRHHRFFLAAEAQYAIRSEGAFNYLYANDVSWNGGPGVYLLDKDDCSLSLQAMVSGDTKGKDEFGGYQLTGTSETGVYLGPQINFTWRDRIVAQLGAALPVSIETDGIQIVPTYRIFASATFHF